MRARKFFRMFIITCFCLFVLLPIVMMNLKPPQDVAHAEIVCSTAANHICGAGCSGEFPDEVTTDPAIGDPVQPCKCCKSTTTTNVCGDAFAQVVGCAPKPK